MKNGIVFILVGLLALGATQAFGVGSPLSQSVSLLPDGGIPEENSGIGSGGPYRDPEGDDWISYCDDPSVFWSTQAASQIWVRQRFTAPADFTLQLITVAPDNRNNVAVPFNLYVYSENRNNLAQRVYSTTLNNGLPDGGGPWYEFDLGEENYVEFAENATFSVVWGPCPGQSPDRGGRGYWPQSDGAGNYRSRSYLFIGNAPTNDHAQWTDVVDALGGGDICTRVNGTLAQYVDLAVDEVYNSPQNNIPDGGRFIVPTGSTQRYFANLKNLGASNVDLAIVTFTLSDSEDEVVWSREVIIDGIQAHDSLQVACDTTFTSDEAGMFYLEASVMADEDANAENDVSVLEQTVWDPINGYDEFVGYTDGDVSGSIGGLGFGAAFPKPIDEFLYQLNGFRILVFPTDSSRQNVPIAAGIFDPTNQFYRFFFMDTLQTDGSLDPQWMTVDLTEALPDTAQLLIAAETEMFVAFAAASEDLRIGQDGSIPSAGTNALMPPVMWTATGDFGRVGPSESSDYAVEFQVMKSDQLPPGPHLKIVPDTLDFGVVSLGQDHVIEAEFISFGADTVNVTNITIPLSIRSFLTLSQVRFSVAPMETSRVTVTFRTDVDTTIATQLGVSSNWPNPDVNNLYRWRVMVTTTLSVNEHVQPGIPGEYALNQNYPNPFNPTTNINFALARSGDVTFGVYDMNGRLVGELFNGHLDAGYHSFEFDANDLPAGVYTYRLVAGEFTSTRKMVLMK